jgi:hypothetical protein
MWLKFCAFILVLMYHKGALMTQILLDKIRFGFCGSGGEVTK